MMQGEHKRTEDEGINRPDACATDQQSGTSTTRVSPPPPRYLSTRIPNPVQHWRSRGYLPHLTVENGTYFVTFRLGDSLPQTVLKEYQRERDALTEQLKDRYAVNSSLLPAPHRASLHEEQAIERLYSEKVEAYMDSGAGSCILCHPAIATMTANALQHFDGQRYRLHAWVVMPNHVHAMFTPNKPFLLQDILHSWKSFTAHQINRILNRNNETVWQRESYDHLVRDDDEFLKLLDYILQNPVKAGLCSRPEDWSWLGWAKQT